MRLITIPLSHYCERARWALDRAGLAYREEQHLQCFHWPYVLWHGGRRTVPLLLAERATLRDSADIVRYADARCADEQRKVYPRAERERREVESLERDFAENLGVATRLLLYFHFFNWGFNALPINDGDAPTWEQLALRALYYPMRTMMGRYVGIDAESLQQSRDTIERALDDVAARLDDGRPYLCGDRFSAADMTFASMLAILVLPEQYGVQLPRESDFPEAAQVDISHARAHPAGQYALRVYAAERR